MTPLPSVRQRLALVAIGYGRAGLREMGGGGGLELQFGDGGVWNPGAVKLNKIADPLGYAPIAVNQVLSLFFGEVDGCANKAGNLDRAAGASFVVPLSLRHVAHSSKYKGLGATFIDIHKGLRYYSTTKQSVECAGQTAYTLLKNLVYPHPASPLLLIAW